MLAHPAGGLLRANVRGSLRMPVLFGVGDRYCRAWAKFLHTVQTGEPAFDHVRGMNAFEPSGRPERTLGRWDLGSPRWMRTFQTKTTPASPGGSTCASS
jgi:hypothetical protein